MEEEAENNVKEASESDCLSSEEQEQFAVWLSRQDPNRRKQYLKLAQAYGFKPSDHPA